MWDSLSEMFVGLLKLAASGEAQTPAEKEALENKIANVRKWNFLAHKLREERQALIAEAVKVTSGNWDKVFEQVSEWDKAVEIMHPSNPRRNLRKTWSSYF
jgi:hypothetical protein